METEATHHPQESPLGHTQYSLPPTELGRLTVAYWGTTTTPHITAPFAYDIPRLPFLHVRKKMPLETTANRIPA